MAMSFIAAIRRAHIAEQPCEQEANGPCAYSYVWAPDDVHEQRHHGESGNSVLRRRHEARPSGPRAISAPRYSSSLRSFASTLRSSSVDVSPVDSRPAATSLSSRRMIFPLRVFGSASVKRMASGLANLPISLDT